MRLLFKELIKGNLPDGFTLEKGEVEFEEVSLKGKQEEYFSLYHIGNPSGKDLMMSFNYRDTKRKKIEEKFKKMFEWFRYRLNKKTKMWEH